MVHFYAAWRFDNRGILLEHLKEHLKRAALVKSEHSTREWGTLWGELVNTADKGGGKLVCLRLCVCVCVLPTHVYV